MTFESQNVVDELLFLNNVLKQRVADQAAAKLQVTRERDCYKAALERIASGRFGITVANGALAEGAAMRAATPEPQDAGGGEK